MAPPAATPTAPTRASMQKNPPGGDNGNPVFVLRKKGITEANKASPRALANALKQFGDYRKENKQLLINQAMASQLIAITKLLDEAIPEDGSDSDSRLATQGDIKQAVSSIIVTPQSGAGLHNGQ